jgi:hypothetical protein
LEDQAGVLFSEEEEEAPLFTPQMEVIHQSLWLAAAAGLALLVLAVAVLLTPVVELVGIVVVAVLVALAVLVEAEEVVVLAINPVVEVAGSVVMEPME